jgi:serine/threonine protein kinase
MLSCRYSCYQTGLLLILHCLQEEIIHEAQTMKSYNHKNVLPLYTSFVHGQDLWMVTPFMCGGSVLHIMKYQHPDVSAAGFECNNSSQCS